MLKPALVAALALLAAPIAAHAAIFTSYDGTLAVRGGIAAGDGARLAGLLADRSIRTVSLNSPGGLVHEGIAMADAIHAYHVDVVVPDGAVCASACFLLFAAGEHKTVGHDVRIGVHSATTTGGKGDDDGNGTLLMARYAAQEGVPAAVVGRMVETDSINMTWLNDADLRSMDAVVSAPNAISSLLLIGSDGHSNARRRESLGYAPNRLVGPRVPSFNPAPSEVPTEPR